jgi:hypothetical protein
MKVTLFQSVMPFVGLASKQTSIDKRSGKRTTKVSERHNVAPGFSFDWEGGLKGVVSEETSSVELQLMSADWR